MFNYAIIGSGNWGRRIYSVLENMNKDVFFIKIKPRAYEESIKIYTVRINQTLSRNNKYDILWVASRPGSYQFYLIREAIKLNKNIICEKPLLISKKKIDYLYNLAKKKNVLLSIHFEYLFLKKLNDLSLKLNSPGVEFEGTFSSEKNDRFKISSSLNLGIHIASIYCMYFYDTKFIKIFTKYNFQKKRELILRKSNYLISLNFTNSKEQLIRKFIKNFEDSALHKKDFFLDFSFYLKVISKLEDLKLRN